MNMTTVAAAALTVVLGAMPLDAKTNVWYVSSDPAKGSESNDGKTPETPFLKIDTAMSKCTSKDDFDEIRLLPGTYKTPEMENGYVKYKTSRIAIIGHTGNRDDVIIDGCGTNKGLYSDTYSVSNRLEAVTVSNCYMKVDSGNGAIGGAGLQILTAYSVISNCVFTDCRLAGSYRYLYGGALLLNKGRITVVDCVFLNNGGAARGGAAYVGDGQLNNVFIRCAFTNNCARKIVSDNPTGGAISGNINANQDSYVTLEACTFYGNVVSNDTGACNGGAVFGRAKMRGCVFTDNRTVSGTTAGDGAGWCCLGSAATDACASFTNELIDCTFAGNFAQGDSGAAQTTKAHHLVVSNCLFRANGSLKGAGAASFAATSKRIMDCRFVANSNCVYAVDNGIVKTGGDCLFARCEFRGNVSHGYSSALHLSGATEALPAIVDSCTFSANLMEADDSHTKPYNINYAGFCGPVCMAGSYIQLRNCLFAANTNYLSNGGAIVMTGQNGSLNFTGRVIDNCTFVGNRATPQGVTAGGGVSRAVAVFTSSPVGGAACRNLLFSDNRNVQDETLLSDMNGSNWESAVTNCLFETEWTVGTCIEDGYNGCKVGKTVKFLNAAQGDYTLRRSSPACGAGVWIDWMDGATDLAGTPRVNPEFGAPDMGCYTCWHKPGLLLLLK